MCFSTICRLLCLNCPFCPSPFPPHSSISSLPHHPWHPSPSFHLSLPQPADARHLRRKLPLIISKHQRLFSLEITHSPTASAYIPLGPCLPLLPLAVSHLLPLSPLPLLPSLHGSSSHRYPPPHAAPPEPRGARPPPPTHVRIRLPAFRPDHRLASILAARLATSRRLPSLRRLLQLVLSR